MNKTYYTPSEIADMLDVSAQTIRRLCRNGKIRAMRVGILWKISHTDLNDYLTSNGGSPLPSLATETAAA